MIIYGLVDPRDNQLRYVGFTRQQLQKRLTAHLQDAKNYKEKSHRVHWLRGMIGDGVSPEMFVIEDNPADWREAESFWIDYFKSIGANLVNSGGGGPGPWESSSAPGLIKFRKTVSEKMIGNKNGLGRKLTDEQKEKLRRMNLGHPTSEKTRQAIIASNKRRKGQRAWNKGLPGYWLGKRLPDETKKKISETRRLRKIPGVWKGKTIPQSTRDKISETLKAYFKNRGKTE